LKGLSYSELRSLSYDTLKQISEIKFKNPAYWCLPKEQVNVKFRQVRWTILYIMNAQYGIECVPDPLEKGAKGISIHGWEESESEDLEDDKFNKAKTDVRWRWIVRKGVQVAKMVSEEESYRYLSRSKPQKSSIQFLIIEKIQHWAFNVKPSPWWNLITVGIFVGIIVLPKLKFRWYTFK